jgi:hypothetical protein
LINSAGRAPQVASPVLPMLPVQGVRRATVRPGQGGRDDMFVLVDDCPGVGSIGYDDSIKAVILNWFKNDDGIFRARMETELRLILERGLTTVIVDTSQAKGVLSLENQAWIADDFFPRLSKTGLRALVSVVPQSAIAHLTNKRTFVGAQVPFEIVQVDTVAEAHDVAVRVMNGAPAVA